MVIRVIIAGINVLAISNLIVSTGILDYRFFNKTCLSAAVFFLSVMLTGKTLNEFKQNRKSAIVSYTLAFLLTFTELLGLNMTLMWRGYSVSLNFWSVVRMLCDSVALAFLSEPFFFWLCSQKEAGQPAERPAPNANRVFLLVWLAIFVGYIPCFLAFYPGLYAYDMVWQWNMFISGTYSTHHPLIHTILSGWLIETGNRIFGSYYAGMACHSIVQMVLLSGCMAFSVRFLYRLGISRKVWLAVTAWFILFPFFSAMSVSTTKDVIFSGLFLMVFVCLWDMVRSGRLYRGRKLVMFLALAVLMGMFRNNAIHGMAVMIVCLLLACVVLKLRGRSKDTRRLLIGISAMFLVIAATTEGMLMVLAKSVHATKGSVVETLSVPCQQMARVYLYHKDEISPKDRELLLSYIPEQSLEQYTHWISDPVKNAVDVTMLEEKTKAFVGLWFRLGKQFPGEYALATLYNTMGIWYMGGDSSCYVSWDMINPVDEIRQLEFRSKLPLLKDMYSWLTDYNIQRYLPMLSILFYTPFYTWVVVICGGILITRQRGIYLIPITFCMGYAATLALGPCIIIRYMLPIMICCPILLAVTLGSTACGQTTERGSSHEYNEKPAGIIKTK